MSKLSVTVNSEKANLNLRTGEVETTSNSPVKNLSYKNEQYSVKSENGKLKVSEDDLKEIIFEMNS